jgi:hypothetical protein
VFQKRLTYDEVKSLVGQYGTTHILGFGDAIVKITGYEIDPSGTKVAKFIAYLADGEIIGYRAVEDLVGWTPYNGPIPPHFGGLPGGMGGQGYGQGQAFPSPWGGQGTPGGWGTWGN